MKYKLLFILLVLLFSCASITKTKRLEKNVLKKTALENSQTAKDFLNKYEYTKAIEYFKESLNYNIMIDNIPGIIKNYTDIGKVYFLTNDFNSSIENLKKASNIADQEKNVESEKAYTFNTFGEVYYSLKEYKIAKDYFIRALKIENALKNIENQGIIMQNISKIDRIKGDYKKSLERLLVAAKLFEILFQRDTLENYKNLSLAYYSIGLTYSKLENYQKAFEYIKKALNVDKKIENPNGIADDYYALGLLGEKTKMSNDEILIYFTRSRDIFKVLDNVNQFIELSDKIADIYLLKNDLRSAYENKNMIYKLSTGNDKRKTAQEILNILNNPKISDFFTEDEIAKIKDKLNKSNSLY